MSKNLQTVFNAFERKEGNNKLTFNLQRFSDDTNAETEEEGGNEQQDDDEQKEDNKTFTQKDIDSIVQNRLEKENKKFETQREAAIQQAIKDYESKKSYENASEAEKKKLDDEKLKAQAETAETARLEAERQLTLYRAKDVANAELEKLGIPTGVADFVVDVDPEKQAAKINNFAEVFKKAVQAATDERLKGTTPKRSTETNAKNVETLADAIASEIVNK